MLKENHTENNLITFQNLHSIKQKNEYKNEIVSSSIHESKAHEEMLQNIKNINHLEIIDNMYEKDNAQKSNNIDNYNNLEEIKSQYVAKEPSVTFADIELKDISIIKKSSFRYLDNNNIHTNILSNLLSKKEELNVFSPPVKNKDIFLKRNSIPYLNQSPENNIHHNKRNSIANSISSDWDLHNFVKHFQSNLSTNILNSEGKAQKRIFNPHAVKKWNILLIIIRLIYRMKNISANQIVSMTDLDKSMEERSIFNSKKKTLATIHNMSNNPNPINRTYKIYNDGQLEHLDQIAKQTLFFENLKSGREEQYENIMNNIKNDPNRFIHAGKKETFFVNKKNAEGFTPLYIVTLNGHYNLVKTLIENGADHLIKNGENEESILETSIRWNMNKVFEYLINNLIWPKDYLESALEISKEYNNMNALKELKFRLKKLRESKRSICRCFSID